MSEVDFFSLRVKMNLSSRTLLISVALVAIVDPGVSNPGIPKQLLILDFLKRSVSIGKGILKNCMYMHFSEQKALNCIQIINEFRGIF